MNNSKFITPDELQKVKDATDIVNVIERFVELKKTGSDYVGKSPWNDEKTPSFHVHPQKQIFKDFSSGIGGDVFKFLVEHPGAKMKFIDAVHMLAKEAGITFDYQRKKPDNEPRYFADRMYELNAWAADFFHKNLGLDGAGSRGLDYLIGRGIEESLLIKHKIGYAENLWHYLQAAAHKKGFKDSELQYAGLVIHNKTTKKGCYDAFRDRVTFPVIIDQGKVAGFGARVINETTNPRDKEGKYLNSNNNTVYRKRKLLYGLAFAKQSMRIEKKAYIVEGYLDVIGLNQIGVWNVVASCGTALTDHHAYEIKKYCNEVVVMFDPDPAGQKATVRGIDRLLAVGLKVNICILPEEKDPFDYATNLDPKTALADFNKYVQDHTGTFLQFLVTTTYLIEPDATKKSEAINKITYTISKVYDEILRTEYVKELAAFSQQNFDTLNKDVINKNILNKEKHENIMDQKFDRVRLNAEVMLLRLFLNFHDIECRSRKLGEIFMAEMSEFEFRNPQYQNLFDVLNSLSSSGLPITVEEAKKANTAAGRMFEKLYATLTIEEMAPSIQEEGFPLRELQMVNRFKRLVVEQRIDKIEKTQRLDARLTKRLEVLKGYLAKY